ncbi:MAG: glycosyltransferase family 4 protein [Jaaginema sp. PMC 1079.18]|nr:glycosyltransferase family 4 protein [Jaaginema sp. PMC 1080.18]MEC4851384.1 glycosyltransferase family 4 protein [Jaaginema sp. PMC 1079.18]MEC4866421.1 glycosyltransferase family 4 protein [Jaaginema sp. PMC 1078.18]
MKIALVCPYDWSQPGGVQSQIRDLAQILGDRDHIVKIITPQTRKLPEESNQIIGIGKSYRLKFQGTQIDISLAIGQEHRKLKEILNQEKFDLIHFHTIWNPFLPLQILALSQTTNIATFHDTPQQTRLGKLAMFLLMPTASQWLLKHYLEAAIAVSQAPATYLKKSQAENIYIIPNGIFVKKFNNNLPFTQYLDGKFNILFLGRLEQRKGIFYLLKAFALLKPDFPHIRLLIAGDGYQKPGIQHFIQQHNLKDVILLNFVSEADKLRYYATCDLYCSPAFDGESFGLVLIEAMASGKPVVAAANLGYQTVLTGEGKQALTIPKSVFSLRDKLAQMIANPEFRQQISHWGKENVQQYDWQIIVERIEQVYQKTVSSRSRSK